MSKWRLWLLAHGIEFEWNNQIDYTDGFKRHIVIAINHRYFGANIMITPIRGVFRDELHKSHAEIAAEYERDGSRD